MTPERFAQIDDLMNLMNVKWAMYWCESEACCCNGCANGSGRLAAQGFTKEEWQEWWRRTLHMFLDQ